MRFLPDAAWPVAVVGAGTMGPGIALQAARFGHEVRVTDPKVEALEAAGKRWGAELERLGLLGLLPEGAQAVRSRLASGDDVASGVARADVVMEAVPEDLEVKQAVLAQIEDAAGATALLATCSSALPVKDIATGLDGAARLVGTHFGTPPTALPLLEVLKGHRTRADALRRACQLGQGLAKHVVVLPASVTTRVLLAIMLAALDRHSGQPTALDAGFRRLDFPAGPFEIMDRIGLDVCAAMAKQVAGRVPASLHARVDSGELGLKTGRGFFAYEPGGKRRGDSPPPVAADAWPILAYGVDEAASLVAEGVAPAHTVDRAMRLGAAFPMGPLALAQAHGIAKVIKAHRTGKGKPADPLLAAQSSPWYPQAPTGVSSRVAGGVGLVRIESRPAGTALDPVFLRGLEEAFSAVNGAELVLLDCDAPGFLRPASPAFPEKTLERVRSRPVVALLHGALGPAALGLAGASRARVARLDTGLPGGADTAPTTSFQLLDAGRVDAVAHPALWYEAVAAGAAAVGTVTPAEVEALLAS